MASTRRQPGADGATPVIELDLDTRIALAELAVIARDARIRRGADHLVARVKSDAKRHAGSGALLALGALALAWWFNRRQSPPPAPRAPEPPSAAEDLWRDAGLSLAGLLPVLWPLLPRSLRRHVTPGTATTVLSFVAPLIARLFRRKPAASSPR